MSGKRILLVEDDDFLHQLYSDLLTNGKYEVTGVKDGQSAYIKMKENTWDLILLDVILPGLDGFQILNKLSEENVKLSCPVIYLTNLDASDEDKKKLEKAQAYWIKSDMSPPEFVEKVKSVL